MPYQWTAECMEAFTQLKKVLTQAPVLAYPHFEEDFLLETDASGEGSGAVLSQHQNDNTIQPIAFASQTLQPHKKNYPDKAFDRENLFNEAHSGEYGEHLRETKIHSQLSRHCWWPGMRLLILLNGVMRILYVLPAV